MAASQAAIFVSVEDVAIRLGIAHGSACIAAVFLVLIKLGNSYFVRTCEF
jgi:hypothetical protein